MGFAREFLLFSLATVLSISLSHDFHGLYNQLKREKLPPSHIETELHSSTGEKNPQETVQAPPIHDDFIDKLTESFDREFVQAPPRKRDFIDSLTENIDSELNPQFSTAPPMTRTVHCKKFAEKIQEQGMRMSNDQRHMFNLKAGSERADGAAQWYHTIAIETARQKGGIVETGKNVIRYWASIANSSDEVLLGHLTERTIRMMVDHPCPQLNVDFKGRLDWALCDCKDGLLPGADWRSGEEEAIAFVNRKESRPSTETRGQAEYQRKAMEVVRCGANRKFANIFMEILFSGRGSETMLFARDDPVSRDDPTTSFYHGAVTAEDVEGASPIERQCLMTRTVGKIKHMPAHQLFSIMELVTDAINGMEEHSADSWIHRYLASMEAQVQKRKALYDNDDGL